MQDGSLRQDQSSWVSQRVSMPIRGFSGPLAPRQTGTPIRRRRSVYGRRRLLLVHGAAGGAAAPLAELPLPFVQR